MKKTPSDKIIKYAKARLAGHNKRKSKEIAGYSEGTTSVQIEKTDAYKEITVKESLLQHISLDEITSKHANLIKSDNESTSLNAIRLGYERIEPDMDTSEDNDKVTVILK